MQLDRSQLRVLVVDDHPMFRLGLRLGLQDLGFGRVDEAEDGRHALEVLRGRQYDVVLVDLMMPHANGVQVAREVAAQREGGSSDCVVIMLSSYEEPAVKVVAAEAGVASFVGKETSPAKLADIIDHAVLKRSARSEPSYIGTPRLTVREASVLRCLVAGAATKDIATTLHISPETVKDHLRRLYSKLGATDRMSAVAIARRLGLLLLDEIGEAPGSNHE